MEKLLKYLGIKKEHRKILLITGLSLFFLIYLCLSLSTWDFTKFESKIDFQFKESAQFLLSGWDVKENKIFDYRVDVYTKNSISTFRVDLPKTNTYLAKIYLVFPSVQQPMNIYVNIASGFHIVNMSSV